MTGKTRYSKDDLIELCEKALQLIASYQPDPSDRLLTYTRSEVERIVGLVHLSWPLSNKDQEDIKLGIFAVRELEGVLDKLAALCMEISYAVKHPKKR